MNYYNTFILAAADCPVEKGTEPAHARRQPTIAEIEFELLSRQPYHWTQEELLLEVHLRRNDIAPRNKAERAALRSEFYEKSRACLRASPLPKRHGFGLHFDQKGRIAMYPIEGDDYRAFANGEHQDVQLLRAMRNKRAERETRKREAPAMGRKREM